MFAISSFLRMRVLFAAALIVAMSSAAAAQGSTFATIDVPGAGTGAYQGTWIGGIDTVGDIAGTYTDLGGVAHGFLRTAAGTTTTFTYPGAGTTNNGPTHGGVGTFFLRMDSAGDIAGYYSDPNNLYHGLFLLAGSSSPTTFDAPGATAWGHSGTVVSGINTAGVVTGAYRDTNLVYHGFIRSANGTFSAPITAAGAGAGVGQGTLPLCIDAAGDVGGIYIDSNGTYHGFVLPANGTMIEIKGSGTTTWTASAVIGIDPAGDVTGTFTTADSAGQGFVRAANGKITTFAAPGAETSPCMSKGFGTLFCGTVGVGINPSGNITGAYGDADGVGHSFLRDANGAFTQFDEPNAGTGPPLIVGNFGIVGTGGSAINAAGTIAGTYVDTNSVVHGFIYTPKLVPTTTTLTPAPTPNPSVYGEPVTLTAKVSSTAGAPPNGENVVFLSGATSLGMAPLSAGVASMTTTALAAGADSITAVYGGDADFWGSTSPAVSQNAGKASSTTSLTSSLNPSTVVQSVTLTARVKGQFGGTATGTVTFSNGNTKLGTEPVSGNSAALTTSVLPKGTDTITAVYSGDSSFTGSTSNAVSQKVIQGTPVSANVILSQVNWLATYPNGADLGATIAAGTSFAVNSANGNLVYSTIWGNTMEMLNPQTGVSTALGTYNTSGGVTLDSKNDLYVAGQYNQTVLKVPFVNGAYVPFPNPGASGYKPPANCTGSDTAACVVAPLSNKGYFAGAALAFDSKGDLFFATTDRGSNPHSIWECTAACLLTGTPAPVMLFQELTGASPATTGQLYVGGLAIDPWGNLFFTDSNFINQFQDQSNPNPTSTSTFSDLNELVHTGSGATGFAAKPVVLYTETIATPGAYDDQLDGVSVSANGTVYVADQNDGIFAFPNNGGALTKASVAASMYTFSTQGAGMLTLDAQGDLYVANWSNVIDSAGTDTIAKITVNNVTVPASYVGVSVTNSATLNPVTTILNDVSCAEPETITFGATENGTATTEFAAALIPPTAPATSSCETTLSGGSSFPTAITFKPTAVGNRRATLTEKDSDGNTGTATVSGVGRLPQSIIFTQPASPVTYGVKPITLSAKASSGLAVTFSVQSGPAKVSGNTLTVTGAGTVVVAANQAGNADYSAAAQVTHSVTVNKATLTVSATDKSMTYGGVVPVLTYTITGFVDGDTAATATSGTARLTTAATSASAAGNYTITAAPGTLAAANYGFTMKNGMLTINKAAQTITFTPPPTPVVFGVLPIKLVATSTSGLAVTFIVRSGPGKVAGTTLTITGAGKVVVEAKQAGNGDYTAAPEVTQSIVVDQATPSIGLKSSANPVALGKPVTFTATLTGAGAKPTGKVTFLDGATALGTRALNANDVATYTTSSLAAGKHSITASYSGDSNYAAVTSAALSETVP